MRLIIIVASPEVEVEQVVRERKESLIPEPLRRNAYQSMNNERVTLSHFYADENTDHTQTVEHIKSLITPDVKGVLMVSDLRIKKSISPLEEIVFANYFTMSAPIASPTNFFGSILNRALKDYRAFCSRFDDMKYRKAFTLPLRNFKSQELVNLRRICSSSIELPSFADRLDLTLKRLRETQKPKQRRNAQEVYFVDSDGKHFALGHERHAQADTSIPPHTDLCVLSNQLRFGRLFDGKRHYNVTKAHPHGTMDEHYPDCHSSFKSGEGKTHLNMFSNDFF